MTFLGRPEDNEYYQSQDLAFQLAKEGYTIINGGGGGIMEQQNCGAMEVGENQSDSTSACHIEQS